MDDIARLWRQHVQIASNLVRAPDSVPRVRAEEKLFNCMLIWRVFYPIVQRVRFSLGIGQCAAPLDELEVDIVHGFLLLLDVLW